MPPTNRRSCFSIIAMSAMTYCVHGIDNPRRRTLSLGATTARARSMYYVAAFQSPRYLRERKVERMPPPPSTSGWNPHYWKTARRTGRICLAASTGWINPDTLIFHDTIDDGVDETTVGGCGNNIDEGGDTKVIYPSPSAVERLLIRDRLVYVKRDDALHLPCSNISGNKGRKFLSLNNIPALDFPDAIVSYGGPQSNAMVALAAIVSSKNVVLRSRGRNPPEEVDRLTGMDGDYSFRQLEVSGDDVLGRDKNENAYISQIVPSSSSKETIRSTTTAPVKRFVYYTKTMPRYLRKHPNGNLLRAMALGMEIRTLTHEEYNDLFGGMHGGSVLAPADLEPPVPGRSLWVPQGGACGIARPGSDALAGEIVDFWSANGRGMPLAVCVPGGTCTTALLLHRSIDGILERRRVEKRESLDIRVVVIPCVGDDEYAMRQMMSLNRSFGEKKGRGEDMPWVLKPRTDIEYGSARRRSKGYFTFGEPAKAIIQTFDEMNEHGLFLDLLYGAPALSLLLQHWTSRASDCPIAGRQVMYVHSGGLEGIASQLTRYKHKGLIDARTTQIS